MILLKPTLVERFDENHTSGFSVSGVELRLVFPLKFFIFCL
jgi:hypothetical protein